MVNHPQLKLELECKRRCKDMQLYSVDRIILKKVVINFMNFLKRLKT